MAVFEGPAMHCLTGPQHWRKPSVVGCFLPSVALQGGETFLESLRCTAGMPGGDDRTLNIEKRLGVSLQAVTKGSSVSTRDESGKSKAGGLSKGGGLAQKAPIGPKRALSGQFLLFPRGCGVQRNWSRSAPKRPR